MKCSDVYLYICANLDQNLNSARCRRIKKHIAGCPDCSAYLESLRTTISLYRAYPTPRVPQSVHRRLFKVIHTLEKQGPPAKRAPVAKGAPVQRDVSVHKDAAVTKRGAQTRTRTGK